MKRLQPGLGALGFGVLALSLAGRLAAQCPVGTAIELDTIAFAPRTAADSALVEGIRASAPLPHTTPIELFALLPDSSLDHVNSQDEWPAETEVRIIIFKGTPGAAPLAVTLLPNSHSSDWHLQEHYRFDAQGRTVLFEMQFDGLANRCNAPALHETTTDYFASDFRLIAKTYAMTSGVGGQALDPAVCGRLLGDSYQVFSDAAALLGSLGLFFR